MAASDRGGARGKAGRAAGEKDGLIRPRQWLALVGLAVAAFVFNTSEFVPIGLLTDIGASFSLAEEGAAVMISVYAWGVMLMSLPLMVLASRVGLRRLMLGLLALFATGQFLCAVAPTFWLLVAARLVVAAAHSVFWAVVMVVASRVVDPRASSAAIGLVATGSSVAQIVGMPLGRAIGLALGWRMTFAAMGVASVATLAYLAVVFPSMGPGERFGLWQLPGLFRNRSLVALYVVAVFLAAGQFAAYSYVEPFLLRVAGLPARGVTLALSAFGCAGLLGSVLFSRLYDGNRRVFLAASLLGESAVLLWLLPAAASPASMGAALVGWGACQSAPGGGHGGHGHLLWPVQPGHRWRHGAWRRCRGSAGRRVRRRGRWRACGRGHRRGACASAAAHAGEQGRGWPALTSASAAPPRAPTSAGAVWHLPSAEATGSSRPSPSVA